MPTNDERREVAVMLRCDVPTECNMTDGELLDEIADTIQACCNLAAALGVHDLTPYLARCEERNRERGRYGEGEPR